MKIPKSISVFSWGTYDFASNIFAVNMLREGQNLTDIEEGVVVQLDGEVRNFIQKQGRVMRNKKNPTIHLLYVKDTRDEEYLKESIKGLEKYTTNE